MNIFWGKSCIQPRPAPEALKLLQQPPISGAEQLKTGMLICALTVTTASASKLSVVIVDWNFILCLATDALDFGV